MDLNEDKHSGLQYALLLIKAEKTMEKHKKETKRLKKEVGILIKRCKARAKEKIKEEKSLLRTEAPVFKPGLFTPEPSPKPDQRPPPPPPPVPRLSPPLSPLTPSPLPPPPPATTKPQDAEPQTQGQPPPTPLSPPLLRLPHTPRILKVTNKASQWDHWKAAGPESRFKHKGKLLEHPGGIQTTWIQEHRYRVWLFRGKGLDNNHQKVSVKEECVRGCICRYCDPCKSGTGRRRKLLRRLIFVGDEMRIRIPETKEEEYKLSAATDSEPEDKEEEMEMSEYSRSEEEEKSEQSEYEGKEEGSVMSVDKPAPLLPPRKEPTPPPPPLPSAYPPTGNSGIIWGVSKAARREGFTMNNCTGKWMKK